MIHLGLNPGALSSLLMSSGLKLALLGYCMYPGCYGGWLPAAGQRVAGAMRRPWLHLRCWPPRPAPSHTRLQLPTTCRLSRTLRPRCLNSMQPACSRWPPCSRCVLQWFGPCRRFGSLPRLLTATRHGVAVALCVARCCAEVYMLLLTACLHLDPEAAYLTGTFGHCFQHTSRHSHAGSKESIKSNKH